MSTYDESGRVLDDQPSPGASARMEAAPKKKRKGKARRLNGPGSVGASIWEMFHPGAVQDEAAAVGAEIPSKVDVIAGGFSDAVESIPGAIGDAVNLGGDAMETVKRLAVIGAVVWIAFEFWKESRK